jgi:hypothetical protein
MVERSLGPPLSSCSNRSWHRSTYQTLLWAFLRFSFLVAALPNLAPRKVYYLFVGAVNQGGATVQQLCARRRYTGGRKVHLMELELIEPYLFLGLTKSALLDLVNAFVDIAKP